MLLCSAAEQAAPPKQPNSFWGYLAHCSTGKLKQLPDLFSFIPLNEGGGSTAIGAGQA